MVSRDEGVEIRGQHDLTRLGACLEAGGDVHGVTKRGEVDDRSGPDVADEGRTGAGGYAEREVVDGPGEVEGGQRRLPPVVGAGQPGNEQSHDFVADQLVDEAVVAYEHVRGGAVEPVQTTSEF